MSSQLLQQRRQKDKFFQSHPQSPLTAKQRAAFTGLAYYPPNPALVLEPDVKVFTEQEQILIATNRDELKPFFRYGQFTFTVDETEAKLTIFRSPDDYYFLPFADANAGTETYPAGRYLDLSPGRDKRFVVDFNLAYNPYCAYNDLFVCPVTPPENRIAVAVRAGEKLPQGEWVGHE